MKVWIIHNDQEKSLYCTKKLQEKLARTELILDQEHPDVVITIGGDGTLLGAFHQYEDQLDHVRFTGVHTGHLGFYTDWRDYELDELVESLLCDQKESVSYPLLEVTVHCRKHEPRTFVALNESTVRCIHQTLIADIAIQKEWFERFLGDGLALSTPTGSTAYNKSLGGAVIEPTMNVFQLTEMAALNNSVFHTLGSSMILQGSERVDIHLEEDKEYIVTIDQKTYTLNDLQSLSYTLSKKRIQFAKYRHTPFWKRVKAAFLE
ncbi:NAD kinase [Catellicoccus marimammalium]|uniref:NAD kinase n=1 Tax=Catellicoccus marimammalium M35/04/3 TaxID=1234409 RepID=K8ZMR1_9ENTE|nr:NAD kinase [Catellicoccus marimammalium]EKU27838.1 NAD kinase [Catellicoccus marimammalium M35/04/3]